MFASLSAINKALLRPLSLNIENENMYKPTDGAVNMP
jgi:hypothetical protein